MIAAMYAFYKVYKINLEEKRKYPQIVEQYITNSRYIFLGLIAVLVIGFVLMPGNAIEITRRPLVVQEDQGEGGAGLEIVEVVEGVEDNLLSKIREALTPPEVSITNARIEKGVLYFHIAIIAAPGDAFAISVDDFYVSGAYDGTANLKGEARTTIQEGEVVEVKAPVEVSALTTPLHLNYIFGRHTYKAPIVMDKR